ncbi:MAG: PfkB family carbohydrate kinase [Verrucomicrobiales bacterium]|nr:PfkB family carbohydrate kinase [Verrucomicrobiales bacterium]
MSQSVSATDLLDRFSKQRILVVGDIMLDWFIWGSVSRISPEAPVPVVEVQEEDRYPGGAANVARNLTPFVTSVELAGLYGKDPNGALLSATLENNRIGARLCLEIDSFQTITKTRVVARHQQVVRIDREKRHRISSEQEKALIKSISAILPEIDGLIIEDYGKGLITQELVSALIKEANLHNVVITVDPKPGNPISWKGVTTVKPNRSEAFACAGKDDIHRDEGVPPLKDEPLIEVGNLLRKKWECDHVLLTLGEQGMLLFSGDDQPFLIPALAKEVFDVSGAGDTAIALYTLSLCSGLEAREAARISNLASSIVVGKLGTSPIELDELSAVL